MIAAAAAPGGIPGPGAFLLQPFNAQPSPGLAGWMADEGVGLAVTTGNRLMLVGRDGHDGVRVHETIVDGASGLAVHEGRTLWVASRWQLRRYEDALAGEAGEGRLFLEQAAHTIGQVGAYDVAVRPDGVPLFGNARCNCVARPAAGRNFTAVWRPPFVSALVDEDRAHVTGLALGDDGAPAYVTCAAATDVAGGWSARLRDGGVVVDACSGEIVAGGLSLPHSPRRHGDRVLVANAGTGELVAIDPADGTRETVVRVDGLARGLGLHGDVAVLGCSRVLADGPYAGAPIGALDPARQRHAVVVVDLRRGAVAHELDFQAASGEVLGVGVIPAAERISAASPAGGLREQLSIGPFHPATTKAGM